jgi:hypothetical protein
MIYGRLEPAQLALVQMADGHLSLAEIAARVKPPLLITMSDAAWQEQLKQLAANVHDASASVAAGARVEAISAIDRHGEHNPENGSTRLTVKFDHPTMIADNLGDQSKSKASSVLLGGNERIEQI